MPKVLDITVTPNGEYLITIFSDKDLSVSGYSNYLIFNLNSQEIHVWDVEGLWEKPLRYKGHR